MHMGRKIPFGALFSKLFQPYIGNMGTKALNLPFLFIFSCIQVIGQKLKNSRFEYSCAAEPPVRFNQSHHSRSESHQKCYAAKGLFI